jgi:hypothetical protein
MPDENSVNGRPKKITPEMVDIAAVLIAKYRSRCAITRMLQKHFGIASRTADRVLAKAREALKVAAGRDLATLKEEAYSFYVSVIRNKHASFRERLLAQQRIDRLMGLESPTVLKHTGSIEVESQDELLERVMSDVNAVDAANALARRMAVHAGGAGESSN